MVGSSSFGFASFLSRHKRRGQSSVKNVESVNSECKGPVLPELHSQDVDLSRPISPLKFNFTIPKIIEGSSCKKNQSLPHSFEGGIDLRPLISVLEPASEVGETDELWDFYSTLEEISSLELKLKNKKPSDKQAGN